MTLTVQLVVEFTIGTGSDHGKHAVEPHAGRHALADTHANDKPTSTPATSAASSTSGTASPTPSTSTPATVLGTAQPNPDLTGVVSSSTAPPRAQRPEAPRPVTAPVTSGTTVASATPPQEAAVSKKRVVPTKSKSSNGVSGFFSDLGKSIKKAFS